MAQSSLGLFGLAGALDLAVIWFEGATFSSTASPWDVNYYFANPGSLELAKYLIQRFVNDARSMGMTPVCVMLYSPDDLRVIKAGIRLDDKLLDFLASTGIAYVDTSQYILNQHSRDDRFESLSVSGTDRHMNNQGNLRIAEALATGLGSMALLGD